MFVDEVTLKLVGGKGGDGCTSFRREKFVAYGGPNGGNGGRGSNIIFKTDKSLRTLIDLKMMKLIKGDKGTNGSGSDKNGASAKDIIIKVPMGTVVTNASTGEVIADLVKEDEEKIIASGGRGGRGNKAFATNENKAPMMSELGQPGEELEIKCELKMLADVGLIGLPNVGKSTILSMITNATPKIAPYHFTTLSPNLGVVKIYDSEFVMADLPGLIEGASTGLGLGFKFLRHASRTKVLAHVLDMSGSENRDPIVDYELILNEIKAYDENLLNKKSVVIANKMDIEGSKDNLILFKKKYPNIKVFEISAALNQGFKELLVYLNKLVKESLEEEISEEVVYKYEKKEPFKITKEGNIFVISGKEIEDLVAMTRFDEEESLNRFIRVTKAMKVDEALEEAGAKRGDEVKISDYFFNFKY
ncbi:MAG TPA: GTPase ObgE [Mollicutes bacterium]|jgi:GTP-binding protein|nr:GTPase ObgE [Mollicutes bacterium]